MFFNISKTKLGNYPCHWELKNFVINTDQGWTHRVIGETDILYKGYADESSIDQLLEQIKDQSEPHLIGNFCAFVITNNEIKIKSDRYRGFPIYIGQGVNNLIPTNHVAWTDSLVTVHGDLTVTEEKFDLVGKIETAPMSLNDVLHAVADIIDRKTVSFLKHNQLPIRSFLSGGVDSMLVYSFLRKHTDNFELIKYSHVEYDYFWLKNSSDITKNWGYNQIHHWLDQCILTSGTPGDEFMLRSPVTADLFLKHHNVEILNLLAQSQWKDSFQHSYFSKDKNTAIFNSQSSKQQSLEELHWQLCNINANDWQHWHIGNTLTWTPLRDLEIFKLIMRLPIDDVTKQVMDSDFSIRLIENNCPGLSAALSDRKNTGNVLANLINLV